MKPPIFLDESGDILVLASAEAAVNYVEPIDVINNEYIGFDSEGRLLRLTVSNDKRVRIKEAESEPQHSEVLRGRLARWLQRANRLKGGYVDASLEQLVLEMTKYGDTRRSITEVAGQSRKYLNKFLGL